MTRTTSTDSANIEVGDVELDWSPVFEADLAGRAAAPLPEVQPPAGTAADTTTNPYPHVPLPAGAVRGGEWGDEDHPWRVIYGQRHEIGAYVTGAWACQQSDGAVQGNDRHDVYVDEMEHGDQCERLNLSVIEARQLAHALLAAADEVDGWTR